MPCCGNTLATHGCYFFFFFSSPATKLQTHRCPESRWRPTPWILACPISAHQASGSGPPKAFGTRGTTAENVVLVAYRKIPKIKLQVLFFFRYQCGGPLRRSSLPAKSGMSWIQRMNQSLSAPDLSIGVVLNPVPCLIHKFGCEGRSRQSTTYSKGDPCDIFCCSHILPLWGFLSTRIGEANFPIPETKKSHLHGFCAFLQDCSCGCRRHRLNFFSSLSRTCAMLMSTVYFWQGH